MRLLDVVFVSVVVCLALFMTAVGLGYVHQQKIPSWSVLTYHFCKKSCVVELYDRRDVRFCSPCDVLSLVQVYLSEKLLDEVERGILADFLVKRIEADNGNVWHTVFLQFAA